MSRYQPANQYSDNGGSYGNSYGDNGGYQDEPNGGYGDGGYGKYGGNGAGANDCEYSCVTRVISEWDMREQGFSWEWFG